MTTDAGVYQDDQEAAATRRAGLRKWVERRRRDALAARLFELAFDAMFVWVDLAERRWPGCPELVAFVACVVALCGEAARRLRR